MIIERERVNDDIIIPLEINGIPHIWPLASTGGFIISSVTDPLKTRLKVTDEGMKVPFPYLHSLKTEIKQVAGKIIGRPTCTKEIADKSEEVTEEEIEEVKAYEPVQLMLFEV